MIRALILMGEGLNCQVETAKAFELAGALPEILHVRDLYAKPSLLDDYQVLAIPGGFSYGDHLGAGKALGASLSQKLGSNLKQFANEKKLILGICNGFQVLLKMGLLDIDPKICTLTLNESGRFEDRWVHLFSPTSQASFWFEQSPRLHVPVRHGEGRFYLKNPDYLEVLKMQGQIAVQYVGKDSNEPVMDYPQNPNGSCQGIAGICNKKGNVLALMPHPEAYLELESHPFYPRRRKQGMLLELSKEAPCGYLIFKSAIENFFQGDL